MTRIISASDAQKRFGEMVDMALREPVMVQRHGRDVVTMISVDEYKRLRRLERDALAAHEVDDDTARLIEAAEYNA
ncbi:type II toxin-antitoxin system Phd/YefM family antitoxin [Magnetospirillum aberrantis]|jgi:prevent-host-death family protein|uniref:Antitoxin n=1 Tax=Magnetospirillum aberrantis SpK TaxID=908842 RepID=A0A7C9V079_9PROT|nr:type II toxin-antitoxin system prevent-host-death family antitoxin [Magnetospirillum aberrantis]NFV80954.1 type II toxin-antitoxin system Phd/YefM family antitoxin [Magnetospirillum aberrantis SpK]